MAFSTSEKRQMNDINEELKTIDIVAYGEAIDIELELREEQVKARKGSNYILGLRRKLSIKKVEAGLETKDKANKEETVGILKEITNNTESSVKQAVDAVIGSKDTEQVLSGFPTHIKYAANAMVSSSRPVLHARSQGELKGTKLAGIKKATTNQAAFNGWKDGMDASRKLDAMAVEMADMKAKQTEQDLRLNRIEDNVTIHNQIARLALQGKTPTEIAKLLGVNRSTIYRNMEK
jgi:hypothetical protein